MGSSSEAHPIKAVWARCTQLHTCTRVPSLACTQAGAADRARRLSFHSAVHAAHLFHLTVEGCDPCSLSDYQMYGVVPVNAVTASDCILQVTVFSDKAPSGQEGPRQGLSCVLGSCAWSVLLLSICAVDLSCADSSSDVCASVNDRVKPRRYHDHLSVWLLHSASPGLLAVTSFHFPPIQCWRSPPSTFHQYKSQRAVVLGRSLLL
jgi:hypothetical protein